MGDEIMGLAFDPGFKGGNAGAVDTLLTVHIPFCIEFPLKECVFATLIPAVSLGLDIVVLDLTADGLTGRAGAIGASGIGGAGLAGVSGSH